MALALGLAAWTVTATAASTAPATAAAAAKAKAAKPAKATKTAKAAKRGPPATPRQQLQSEASGLALAASTAEVIDAAQLDIAARVLTGNAECEFNQRVSVMPVDGQPGAFTVGYKNQRYRMVPRETSTGAVRLEDKAAGIVWLQIPTKSMLMNARIGQRLVDACTQSEQRVAMLAVADAAASLGIVTPPPAAASAAATTAGADPAAGSLAAPITTEGPAAPVQSVPSVPSVPGVPVVPAVPTLPSIPSTPSGPSATEPAASAAAAATAAAAAAGAAASAPQ